MTKRERTSEQNKIMLVLSILGFLVAISIIAFIPAISSRDIVLLQGANFELVRKKSLMLESHSPNPSF
jgi:hypothetical protein